MDVIDLIPNSMTFRIVTTLDLADGDDTPAGFTGRVRRHGAGRPVSVAWYHRGLLQNPGRQHPAFRSFRAAGQVKFEMYYTDGSLQDPNATTAAVRGFYAAGGLHYEERWFRGLRQDGLDGTAAIRKWRADGSLRHELHYERGARSGITSSAAR